MSWPTFQQLRYLVAIADAGSFGAAADEEFVSQPALSAQIKELERKLGVTTCYLFKFIRLIFFADKRFIFFFKKDSQLGPASPLAPYPVSR